MLRAQYIGNKKISVGTAVSVPPSVGVVQVRYGMFSVTTTVTGE